MKTILITFGLIGILCGCSTFETQEIMPATKSIKFCRYDYMGSKRLKVEEATCIDGSLWLVVTDMENGMSIKQRRK